jgi:hypothetical protein
MLAEEDVDRSLGEFLTQALEGLVPAHIQGEAWASKPLEWVEPRIDRFTRSGHGRRGPYPVTLVVRCIRVNGHKGGLGNLGKLVDTVREFVDFTHGARPMPIKNAAGETVGTLQFKEADTVRVYGVSVVSDGVSTPACDVATLSVECIAQAVACRPASA